MQGLMILKKREAATSNTLKARQTMKSWFGLVPFGLVWFGLVCRLVWQEIEILAPGGKQNISRTFYRRRL